MRVLPLRWPRRRLASAAGGGYNRFSYASIGIQGDIDTTDSLQLLESKLRATPVGTVEAAIFVQPLCGEETNIACALAAENCFPWCMGVVRGGARAQNVTMFNTARWESQCCCQTQTAGFGVPMLRERAGSATVWRRQ